MTGEKWVGGSYTATFVYNKDGMVTKAEDLSSTYTYAYNADSQVTSVDNAGTTGVPTVTLSLAYDGYQNLTGVSDSLGGSLSYGYNNDNQLSSLGLSVSSTMDAQVTFAYDSANRLTGMTRTGVSGSIPIVSTLSYDNANRLTNIADAAKFTLANYTYAYNKGGELTSYQDNSGNSLTYGYDVDGELTSATGTLASKSDSFNYDYDKNGNRTTTITDIGGSLTTATYSTGSGNELTNDGTYTYTYDNDGNMATQTNLTTHSVTYYSWDYENRLTEAEEKTSSSGTVICDEKYTYDVNGNRIGVSDNGTQELYTVYLGSNPYIDFNGSGTLTERYLFNPQSLNVFYGQVSAGGTTEWFLTDNINSIRQVVSTTGSVLDAITYDPYGNILNQTSTTYEPRFLFTGGAYDSNTGNYQDGAREDDPAAGRWISQDPLGLGPDTNSYRYVGNDPTNAIDPSGEQAVLVMAKIPEPDGNIRVGVWISVPSGEGKLYVNPKTQGWLWQYNQKDSEGKTVFTFLYSYDTHTWYQYGGTDSNGKAIWTRVNSKNFMAPPPPKPPWRSAWLGPVGPSLGASRANDNTKYRTKGPPDLSEEPKRMPELEAEERKTPKRPFEGSIPDLVEQQKKVLNPKKP